MKLLNNEDVDRVYGEMLSLVDQIEDRIVQSQAREQANMWAALMFPQVKTQASVVDSGWKEVA